MARTKNGCNECRTLNPVLQRDHGSFRADQWTAGGSGDLTIPQLDGKQDHVHRPDGGGIISGLNFRDMEISERALNSETILSQHIKITPAGNEVDFNAGSR